MIKKKQFTSIINDFTTFRFFLYSIGTKIYSNNNIIFLKMSLSITNAVWENHVLE